MDHMCLHQYVHSASKMMSTIHAMFRDYSRPIWLNEFACPPYQNCTAEHQLQFMKAALPLLEASPYVYRYAWYVNRDNRDPPKGILAGEGVLEYVVLSLFCVLCFVLYVFNLGVYACRFFWCFHWCM